MPDAHHAYPANGVRSETRYLVGLNVGSKSGDGIEPATSRVENPAQSHRNACLARHGFNAIAETTQFSDHFTGTALCLSTTDSDRVPHNGWLDGESSR
jgi:hypothetical protein